MKRAQLVSQGSLNRILQSAEAAWMRRDFDGNIQLLERANRLAPTNIGILLQLGRMHGLRWNYEIAEKYFDRAISFAPKKTDILIKAGIQCRDLRNTELAEKYFKGATEQKDFNALSFAHLAELYERLRRIDDATVMIERALCLDSKCYLALLAKARLYRQSDQLEHAENLLKSILPDAEREVRVRGYYELGTVLDRAGRYDEAMRAFLEAKALVRSEAAPFKGDLLVIRERLKKMREEISPAMIERWMEAGKLLEPSCRIALLCGHPRSGTTLMEQVLDSHPQIISAEETEVFHDYSYIQLARLSPDGATMLQILENSPSQALNAARNTYRSTIERLLGTNLNGRLLVDKNPSLTFLIPALLRVFPEIKLLIALRDPRDVCLSCFMQPFYPIGQTTSAYLDLESTVDEYVALMSNWLAIKPMLAGSFFEVHYEDMVDDLESVAQGVVNYLGVPWDTEILRFNEHARRKIVRSPTYADVTKPVFKTAMGRWQKYERFLGPYLDKLNPVIKSLGYN